MRAGIELGEAGAAPALLDLEELLATRLLVQGNSGSGKSHLLRRLIEQSAGAVQQAVIDPEGDFVTLAERFGHVVVDASHDESDLQRIAARVRQHRVSVVLTLENLEVEGQLRAAAAFLGGLFEAEREHWFPMLVVVDEAQLFAPTLAAEGSDEARRLSLGAMTNLMCRGRKRGLAGVIATQRLAKLAKNVAAEASNFLMGRTFLDIDMARAADLLGMERRQAEMFRDLGRGQFVALGPALSRRPLSIRIGPVQTSGRSGSPVLLPLPEQGPIEASRLIFTAQEGEPIEPAPVRAPRSRPSASEVLHTLEISVPAPTPSAALPPEPELSPAEREALLDTILRAILAEPGADARPQAVLYQDFTVRCRMRRIGALTPDLAEFRRRMAVLRAGAGPEVVASGAWDQAVATAADLPEELQGLFLFVARAAIAQAPCPTDAELAEACGTHSPRRARRATGYLEERGLLVRHTDFSGQTTLALPTLGIETAPGEARPLPRWAGAEEPAP